MSLALFSLSPRLYLSRCKRNLSKWKSLCPNPGRIRLLSFISNIYTDCTTHPHTRQGFLLSKYRLTGVAPISTGKLPTYEIPVMIQPLTSAVLKDYRVWYDVSLIYLAFFLSNDISSTELTIVRFLLIPEITLNFINPWEEISMASSYTLTCKNLGYFIIICGFKYIQVQVYSGFWMTCWFLKYVTWVLI